MRYYGSAGHAVTDRTKQWWTVFTYRMHSLPDEGDAGNDTATAQREHKPLGRAPGADAGEAAGAAALAAAG